MRKLLLLIVAVCFLCVLASPAFSAEPEKRVIPGKKNVYYVPAQIVVFSDGIRPITDPDHVAALAKRAKENPCMQEIEIPGGDKLYVNYCDFANQPICYRQPDGKQCCPGRMPVCQ